MSGAGFSGAGLGPAGFDPAATPTAPRNVTRPRAILFQLNGSDFTLDSNGLYEDVHPADQWVALQLGIPLGVIGTSPTAGSPLRRVTHVGAPSTRAQVEDAVRVALKVKVDAREIRVERVDYEPTPFGGFKLAVHYHNLLAQAERERGERPRPNTLTVTR